VDTVNSRHWFSSPSLNVSIDLNDALHYHAKLYAAWTAQLWFTVGFYPATCPHNLVHVECGTLEKRLVNLLITKLPNHISATWDAEARSVLFFYGVFLPNFLN